MDFFQARLEGTRKRNYELKQRKLNSALDFIKEYYYSDKNFNSLELKRKANEYFLSSHGIIDYNLPDLSKFPIERIKNIYNEICQKSGQIFNSFYDSYKRKVDIGYNKEFVDNAFQDLLQAYRLYSFSNELGIQEEPTLEQLSNLNEQILKSIKDNEIENIR